jgi:polar amino acid transport system substrate-binding protein
MIKKATNHFSVDYGENLPKLEGNFQRLEQVMINLIQNACQSLPNRDRGVFVSTFFDEDKGHIVVRVEDQGVGIRSDSLTHITDPFFTTKQDAGGVGLGLSISARIIEEHRGRMRFRSEPGKGTTAEVILPYDQTRMT